MAKGVVVAGFDGSDAAAGAVGWAAGEAQRRRRGLVVVHAFGWTLADRFSEDMFRRHIHARLAELAQACRTRLPGLSVVSVLRDGHPSVTLGEVAEAAEAGLIVIGSAGLGAVPHMLLGSTAAELVQAVRRPVVVVGGGPAAEPVSPLPDDGPVVVGVDGSPAGHPAIGFAFDFAARHRCALHAVHAWFDVPLDVAAYASMAQYGEHQTLAAAAEVTQRRLAGWAQRYPEVPVRVECVAQRPTQALLERADNARLLVVGSHGHRAVGRRLLGSVSRAVLYHAPCPVAVIQGPDGDDTVLAAASHADSRGHIPSPTP